MMEKSCIGRESRKGWATPAATRYRFKRYRSCGERTIRVCSHLHPLLYPPVVLHVESVQLQSSWSSIHAYIIIVIIFVQAFLAIDAVNRNFDATKFTHVAL
jgi:hypothetical protein